MPARSPVRAEWLQHRGGQATTYLRSPLRRHRARSRPQPFAPTVVLERASRWLTSESYASIKEGRRRVESVMTKRACTGCAHYKPRCRCCSAYALYSLESSLGPPRLCLLWLLVRFLGLARVIRHAHAAQHVVSEEELPVRRHHHD